ncbi:MAG: AAA family ATPase [Methanosphaera sp.]|nr:AAA family ATPase [Methanosphaera sp.]
MKVYGITGLPGSGKSIISKFTENEGIHIISMGDIVRKEAESLSCSSEVAAVNLRKQYGNGVFAELCVDEIRNLSKETANNQEQLQNESIEDIYIIEGIRSSYEVDIFRENFDDFKIIAIHASPRTRFERLKKRNRSDDSDDFDTFLERDRRELEFGIGNVISSADFMIINDDPIQDNLARMISDYNNKINLDE